jgi:hypothetical protein
VIEYFLDYDQVFEAGNHLYRPTEFSTSLDNVTLKDAQQQERLPWETLKRRV